jgi:hypothetical protein
VTRISLTTLQATGTGFFGLYGSTAALATTLTLAAVVNCTGIGFQRGTHANWQMVSNDATGAPTLTDMGASFAIATGGVLTLIIAAPPNGGSVRVRVVDEVSGAIFEHEITADLPPATPFLSPRLFLNTGATAAAVACDCAGSTSKPTSRSPAMNETASAAELRDRIALLSERSALMAAELASVRAAAAVPPPPEGAAPHST